MALLAHLIADAVVETGCCSLPVESTDPSTGHLLLEAELLGLGGP